MSSIRLRQLSPTEYINDEVIIRRNDRCNRKQKKTNKHTTWEHVNITSFNVCAGVRACCLQMQ